ncbi:MAG: hypothetical protein JWM02_1636 [Frankiales bacterium]|nr:hypothetical protein [Frankiales bacterium]
MSLEEARAAVLRDLADPTYDELVDRCVEQRRWWVEQWANGEPFLVCLVAQDVQEAVHATDPTWPLCAEHGDHPLFVEPDLGTDPFWVCERSGLPFAPVGSLRQLGP